MEDFIFHEGPFPSGYKPDIDYALFNKPAHLLLQAKEGWHAFSVLNKKHQRVEASLYIHIENEIAASPLRNPFGSVECSEDISPVILFQFLEFIESRLKSKGVKRIILKNPPQSYSPYITSLLQTFLFNLGFVVTDAEVGSVIEVSENSFESYPDSWERRKLRQAHEAGLRFRQVDFDQLSEVYLFILACRKQRGYSLSMTPAELKHTVNLFQDYYFLFGVFHEEKLAAASIAIRVKKNILYNFYSAHPREYNHISPVVLLVEGLYQFAQQNRMELLDLGTSALNGKPNFGLLDFKLRLGAKPTTKLTFEKIIS